MITYTTKQGDVLDAVVHRYHGTTAGAVEEVLEANRGLGLADYGPVLPAGLVIQLPEMRKAEEMTTLTRLWD